MFNFGSDITFEFYPMVDGEPFQLPTQTPTIYVYESETKPTRAAAAAGTGADQTISSWNEDEPYVRTFTIDDIDDPDTSEEWKVYTYWVAINYVMEASQQTQTELRALRIARAQSQHKQLDCTTDELRGVWASISEYANLTQLSDYKAGAVSDIKDDLEAAGYEWALMFRPDELKRALIYKVCATVATAEISEGGLQFETLANKYERNYEDKIKQTKISYDSDRDGEPDTTVSSPSFSFTIR